MNAVATTLFEGSYHLGAAGLINSLHAAGFKGTFVCGHRGPPPPWAKSTCDTLPFEVKFWPLTTQAHLTNYKPAFLLECRRKFGEARPLFYFDPDIVVKAPWPTLAQWAVQGIALVEDVNGYMPARHPYRLGWHEFFQRQQFRAVRSLDRYYNAGFFGLSADHADFLGLWQSVLDRAASEIGPLDKLKRGTPDQLFHSADQDALNMALMLSQIPVNGAGPEAMDFAPGGHLLSHAAGGAKPWRGGFLRAAFAGRPPSMPQKEFFHYAAAPIPVFSPTVLQLRKFELQVAAAIGRFYRRT